MAGPRLDDDDVAAVGVGVARPSVRAVVRVGRSLILVGGEVVWTHSGKGGRTGRDLWERRDGRGGRGGGLVVAGLESLDTGLYIHKGWTCNCAVVRALGLTVRYGDCNPT